MGMMGRPMDQKTEELRHEVVGSMAMNVHHQDHQNNKVDKAVKVLAVEAALLDKLQEVPRAAAQVLGAPTRVEAARQVVLAAPAVHIGLCKLCSEVRSMTRCGVSMPSAFSSSLHRAGLMWIVAACPPTSSR